MFLSSDIGLPLTNIFSLLTDHVSILPSDAVHPGLVVGLVVGLVRQLFGPVRRTLYPVAI